MPDDEVPEGCRCQRMAEASIISISSDSDGNGDDAGNIGLNGLRAPVAPLLIARSRTAVQKRSTTATAAVAANEYQKGVEREVIDLT